ncbi:uncharacterized protein M421DRAFT_70240, partial [Didymella exigua CBS 183.55]
CAILCIGALSLLKGLLKDALVLLEATLPLTDPCSLHLPQVEAIIALQDLSVWYVRDVLHSVEKAILSITSVQDRSLPARGSQDFIMMREGALHAIDLFETLSVTVETLEAMQQHIALLADKNRQASGCKPETLLQARMHMAFQARMLCNLLLRSQSNKERLQNEITLAYNMIAQRDSQVMTGLGEVARLDSSAMKTIVVVTMAFLPPTFFKQAIFSMSFSDYKPDQGSTGWSLSSELWVYWICAVPLTCLTLAVYQWRKRRVEHRRSYHCPICRDSSQWQARRVASKAALYVRLSRQYSSVVVRNITVIVSSALVSCPIRSCVGIS